MTKSLLPALIWLIIITFLSTKGGISMPKFNLFQMDKLAHASAYALLSWLILFGLLRANGQTPGLRLGLLVFLFAAGYGALMEVVQYTWFPNRLFEFDDMLANAAGAGLAWLSFGWIAPFVIKWTRLKHPPSP